MNLKKNLTDELNQLNREVSALQRKRDQVIAQVEHDIGVYTKQIEVIQDFYDKLYPSDGSAPAVSLGGLGTGSRVRKDRSNLRPNILRVINSSPSGIRRKGIIEQLNMHDDETGKQYISNIVRDLLNENLIRAESRTYFPTNSNSVESSPLESSSGHFSRPWSQTRET